MMKRVFPFLMLVVSFLLASCGASAVPQNEYVTAMQPALAQMPQWQAEYADLEKVLTDPVNTSTDANRLQMVELYNIATGYKITRDDYVSMGFAPLDALVGPAVKLAKDGHAILDTLSAITPVPETEAAHKAVLECVKTRVAFAEEVASSIKELSSIDMSKAGALADCETLEANLATLTSYINQHK